MSHPTRVSAPVDLTDVPVGRFEGAGRRARRLHRAVGEIATAPVAPHGRPVPAGTALDLGAWDVRILSTENEKQR